MGQKTNPKILRLGNTKLYNYSHIEKKSSEFAFYDFKILEINNFVYKFFKDQNLTVQNCKINYSDSETLHIFISYFANLNTSTNIQNKKEINYQIDCYNLIDYIKFFNEHRIVNLKKDKLIKNKLKNRLKNCKLTYYTNLLNGLKNIKHLKQKYFLTNFLESLYIFINKNLKIYLTVKQVNKNLKKKIDQNSLKIIKKNLVKINRYKTNEFFKKGANIIFLFCQQPELLELLSSFITNELQKTRRHNFFLKFVTKCLKIFLNTKNSRLKGIKIKLTGRINRATRAKHKTIKIGNNLPINSISSNINYSSKTSFTANGTLGIKIWTYF